MVSTKPNTEPREAGVHSAPLPTWLVLGDKRGDNAQVFPIAEKLGWPVVQKNLRMLEPWVLGKPTVGPSLYHIDLPRSDPLEPPWPDLIITVGRRPSMVALWIREQTQGRTKIVLVGKPSSRLEDYDLIIVSSENQLPPLPNVAHLSLPLMRVDEASVRASAAKTRSRFSSLPRPLIAVFIGGPTGPFRFDHSVQRDLVSLAHDIVENNKGTPFLVTSRRTPASFIESLEAELPPQAQLFKWDPDAADNPYLPLLGLADGFVVTVDSISMIVEVVRLRKPLALFSLPTSLLGGIDAARRSFVRYLFNPRQTSQSDIVRIRIARALYHARLVTQTRDFRAFHDTLVDNGLATWHPEKPLTPTKSIPDDVSAAVERVRSLCGIGVTATTSLS